MKLQILGSGGGEGYPALFCGCEHCEAARKAGGKNIRTLSQALIDGKLLIDMPVDTPTHFRENGLNLGEIENLLVTHVHDDHYCPNLLSTRGTDFAPIVKAEKLNIYGNADVFRLFDGYYKLFPIRDEIRKNISFHTLAPLVGAKIGNYSVLPLKANHAPEQIALNYIIDDGNSVLLYLVDSGYPTDETLAAIVGYGKKFACVVIDGTMGNSYYVYHMNFEQNKQLKNFLVERGAASGGTRFIVSHITHNHAGSHDDIESCFDGTGIETAYDGMTVEF